MGQTKAEVMEIVLRHFTVYTEDLHKKKEKQKRKKQTLNLMQTVFSLLTNESDCLFFLLTDLERKKKKAEIF